MLPPSLYVLTLMFNVKYIKREYLVVIGSRICWFLLVETTVIEPAAGSSLLAGQECDRLPPFTQSPTTGRNELGSLLKDWYPFDHSRGI